MSECSLGEKSLLCFWLHIRGKNLIELSLRGLEREKLEAEKLKTTPWKSFAIKEGKKKNEKVAG